jgi:hypothetical protein
MDAIHNNWLNAQASRRYPLDDNATGTGDDRARLNDDVVVDLHMRWPSLAGAYAFIGGITVSKKIVTVVIMAADDLSGVSGFTPLAAVSVMQPAKGYAYYNLEPLYPGVGGFIAFGDIDEEFSIRFSTPLQGLISPKCGRPYEQLPVPSMRKFGRVDGLTGLVKILAGPDLEIVKEIVDVNGVDTEAMVIRLAAPTTARNPLAAYIGPCGKRPESYNCDRPGVQTINGVTPDCDGNIEIAFEGLLEGPYHDCGNVEAGVTLDQEFGLADVCPSRTVELFVGNDYCDTDSTSSLSLAVETLSSDLIELGIATSNSSSSEAIACEDIPFTDCFVVGLHLSWSLKAGAYTLAAATSPASPCSSVTTNELQISDTSRRNIIIWEDCGTGYSSNKKITTQVKLSNIGVMQNAGVILNYRLVNPFTNPQIRYFLAQINRNANAVELYSYNGIQLVLENSVNVGTPFSLNDWYEIEVTVTDDGAGKRINVHVSGVSVPAWSAVSFNLLTNRWGESVGYHGLHTMQAVSNFSYWSLADA